MLSTLFAVLALTATPVHANTTCGGKGQRECTIFEQIPSCDAGLTASRGTCHSCGANGEVACAITVRIPSCDAGLTERSGRCVTPPKLDCGGQGERPCNLWERIPSCDAGLAEDFLAGRCVAGGPDGLRANAEQVLADVGPLLEVAAAAATCTLAGGELDRLRTLTSDPDPGILQDWSAGSTCLPRVLQTAADQGYATVTIGLGAGGSAVLGVNSEIGVAIDVLGRHPARIFSTLGYSSGIGVGVSTSVVVGFSQTPVPDLAGDAQGFVYAGTALAGAGAGIWYDYDGQLTGIAAFVSAGAEGKAAVYTRTTTALSEPLVPVATAPGGSGHFAGTSPAPAADAVVPAEGTWTWAHRGRTVQATLTRPDADRFVLDKGDAGTVTKHRTGSDTFAGGRGGTYRVLSADRIAFTPPGEDDVRFVMTRR